MYLFKFNILMCHHTKEQDRDEKNDYERFVAEAEYLRKHHKDGQIDWVAMFFTRGTHVFCDATSFNHLDHEYTTDKRIC